MCNGSLLDNVCMFNRPTQRKNCIDTTAPQWLGKPIPRLLPRQQMLQPSFFFFFFGLGQRKSLQDLTYSENFRITHILHFIHIHWEYFLFPFFSTRGITACYSQRTQRSAGSNVKKKKKKTLVVVGIMKKLPEGAASFLFSRYRKKISSSFGRAGDM